jgi:hypothetical protein
MTIRSLVYDAAASCVVPARPQPRPPERTAECASWGDLVAFKIHGDILRRHEEHRFDPDHFDFGHVIDGGFPNPRGRLLRTSRRWAQGHHEGDPAVACTWTTRWFVD